MNSINKLICLLLIMRKKYLLPASLSKGSPNLFLNINTDHQGWINSWDEPWELRDKWQSYRLQESQTRARPIVNHVVSWDSLLTWVWTFRLKKGIFFKVYIIKFFHVINFSPFSVWSWNYSQLVPGWPGNTSRGCRWLTRKHIWRLQVAAAFTNSA